jgi:hypothetical protein
MNGIKLESFDIEKLRERLRKMTDAQPLEFGRDGRQLCSPEANFGKPPREVFVIQLEEARAEWRRRHPKRRRKNAVHAFSRLRDFVILEESLGSPRQ